MFLAPDVEVQARVDHIVNTYTGLVWTKVNIEFYRDPAGRCRLQGAGGLNLAAAEMHRLIL